MRRVSLGWIVVVVALTAVSAAQPPDMGRGRPPRLGQPSPDETRGPEKTEKGDEATSPGAKKPHSIMMNLSKGVDVQQIVSFLSEETGKPVLPDPELKGKIKAYSAEKLVQGDALALIYRALEMSAIAVIETPRWIELVPAEKAKQMKIPFLEADESASSLTNKTQIVEKVFKLTVTSPKSLEGALKPLIGKHANISVDEQTKALFITDTVSNIERFEQIVEAVDRVDEGQIIVRVFQLKNADAEELADLVATMAVAGEGGKLEVRQQERDRYSSYRYRRGTASSGGRVAGDVVVIPDARTNWLVVVGPPDKVSRIEKMVEELDVPGRSDVEIHVVDIKHADAYDVANDIDDVFRRKMAREKQEVLEVRSSSRGNQLIILATPETYRMIEELIKELDTVEAVQRETRSYELKYMDANDMAEQLNELYQEESRRIYYPWDYSSRSSREQAKFVPVVRTNSIMVIAPPSEYEFIEKMIEELDVEISEENLAPRVYHITHTDAAEMRQVLTELFEGQATTRRPGLFDPFRWRQRDSRQEGVGALYGKVRFVVYTNTNSIVVITNNPQNFAVIEKLIKDLDVLDPEATDMLVIQLQFADADVLANSINNLLSEGAVARPGQRQPQQQRATDQQQDEEQTIIDVIFPWQASQRRTTRAGEEERPISSLIGQVRIIPDVRSQKLVVAAPSIYFDSLRKLVEELDKPEPQVQLETYIVRVEAEGERRIGWRWLPDPSLISPEELDNAVVGLVDMGFIDTFAGRGGPFQAPEGAAYRIDSAPQPWGTIATKDPQADPDWGRFTFDQVLQPGKGVLSANVNLTLLLQLLVKNRNARVMAHPQVTVNNNENGEIFVGENLPFETSSQTGAEGIGVTRAFQYNEVGTRLQIRPQINKQGRVVLRITIENSRRKPETINGQIVTAQQKYTTKLTVNDGETVWLGGLSEQREEDIIRRVPVLGYIPFLGAFFRKTDKVTLDSVLYTFVRPAVIQDALQAKAQYQRARDRLQQYRKEYEGLEMDLPMDDWPTTPSSTPRAETRTISPG